MDFQKLVQPLSKYYGAEAIEKAIKSLDEWYEEEAYDDDDVIADWQPDACEDSDGILQLSESLNEDDTTALYSHCLYHLLPNQPIPANPLFHRVISPDDPLEQFHKQFKAKLMQKLHLSADDAENIADAVQSHIEEQEYDMECIEEDLANEDESEIIEHIMDKFPKLKDRSTIIFGILTSLTSISDDAAVLSLQMYSTAEDQAEAVALCKQYLKGIFQDNTMPNNNGTKSKDGYAERCFLQAKSWDISNQFPWLSCMADTFARYRLESHKQLCEENKENTPNTSDKAMRMDAKQWFETVDPSTRKLIEEDEEKANVLKHAVMSLFKRLSPVMPLNYKTSCTIWDSVNVYAKYALGIQRFVTSVSSSNDLQCVPIQFDAMVIPQCVSEPMYLESCLDLEDLYSAPMPDFMKTDKIEKPSETTKYLNFGQDDDYNKSKAIWNFADNLNASGYKSGMDYFGPVEVEQAQYSGNDVSINAVVRALNEELFLNAKDADKTRYQRYIIVIDRRDPSNIEQKRMKYSETKTWNDRIYLIRPKKAGQICNEYQYKMNETFIQNTTEFLLPISATSGMGGLESANGYRFLLSFHVHSQDKVKAYWYFQGGSQRFFMNDMEWLWPRFFVKHENQFQSLTKETRDELQQAQKEYPLIDKQFVRYRQGYKLIN
eukprot:58159_1